MTALPAVPLDDSGLMVGFEDFDSSDMVIPRMRLDHTEGVLVDTLSGETYTELELLLLGLVKQRILWPAEVTEEKSGPLCKSLNFSQGLPDHPKFPWAAAGFKPADYTEGTPLPCAGCQLKDWGSNPKNDTSWCAEQYTFALMVPSSNADGWSPALLTLQRSGLKSARAYMSAFARAGKPLFSSTTKLSLIPLKRGSVKYVVPQFVKGAPVPEDQWIEFADQARRIRTFVQTPRDEVVEETPVTATSTRTAAATDDSDSITDF